MNISFDIEEVLCFIIMVTFLLILLIVPLKYPIFFFFLNLFIYFWLCWVFVSVRGLSPVAVSGGHSSSRCAGLSLSRPLLLQSTGSRRAGSAVVAHGPSRSVACGIFPDQGSNPCPLHWQADSQPLRHQGSPVPYFLNFKFLLLVLNGILWLPPIIQTAVSVLNLLSPNHWSVSCSYSVAFSGCHINGIMWYAVYSGWLSLSTTYLRFIRLVACIRYYWIFLLTAE